MAIVRSLLIKIGFVSDRQSESAANKVVDRLKRRYLVAASAITYAFSRLTSFFSDLAEGTLDANDLAKSLGVSLKEVVQIQQALNRFRIDPKQTTQVLENLNGLLRDFRTRQGTRLKEIAEYLKFNIDEENDNALTIFTKILEGLSKVETEAKRIDLARIIFGEDLKVKISDVSKDMEGFKTLMGSFEQLGNEIQKSVQDLREYQQAVNDIAQAWQQFVLDISKDILPGLKSILGALKDAFEYLKFVKTFYSTLFKGDTQGFLDNAKKGSDLLGIGSGSLWESIKSGFSGVGRVSSDLFSLSVGSWWDRFKEYAENGPGYNYNGMTQAMVGAPNITVNNDISVPPGTSEEQAQNIADAIRRSIDESINSTFRTIEYNNPVVE